MDFSLSELAPNKEKFLEPSPAEMVYYMFYTKGIGLEEVSRLPIPYLLTMLETHMYAQKEQEKANKRQK